MRVNGSVSSLLLLDKPIVSSSIQRIAIHADKVTRADVNTLRSREVI